ncbi:MAG: penicillin-binding protein 2 [Patescibacteria group bacterium]|nr:penicillin-binding protein 2 [Patescibacteria group bacterium]
MRLWRKPKQNIGIARNNNRLNLIIAIVFLLGGSILYKLYGLQVREYDLYTAMAGSQHQVYSELQPERGKIFLTDRKQGSGHEELYPFAVNKDFALVYAIPKELEEPEVLADKLFIVFKQEGVEKEVDDLLKKEEKEKLDNELAYVASLNLPGEERGKREAEVRTRLESLKSDEKYRETLAIRREAEINLRKEKIIGDYLVILKKKDDPYEPLEKKVDEKTLKKLYSLLLSGEEKKIEEDNFEIKNGVIFVNDQGGENSKAKEAKFTGLAYAMKSYRSYPENNIGSHVLGFTSYAEEEPRGKYGLEGFFDKELFGQYGSIKAERGAGKDLVIVNDREYKKPVDGSDLVLTINRSVQFRVCQKLNEAALRHGADGGSVIVMEPETGAVIAMCSYPDFDPNNYDKVKDISVFNNPAIFSQYEPGSVFKPITMAAALDQGKVTPETSYNDEGQVMIVGWPKPLKNSDFDTFGGHGEVNMTEVLENSLNTGAIFAMQQTGPEIFADYVKKFGFGEKTGIELSGESLGDIRNLTASKIKPIDSAVASYGQGMSVTPLQLTAAYAAIANGGILMKPYIVKEINHPDGTKEITRPEEVRRVISEKAATILGGMLVNVVEEGHGQRAGVKGYYVAGKTGTAQVARKDGRGYETGAHIGSFAGFAPADDPQFAMLVRIDNPRDVSWAESSAAPLFGEIADFLLQYYQVPKVRE